MSRYDGEDLLDDIEELLKEKMPNKIASIDQEKITKGKGMKVPLAPISSESYLRQSWSEKILNKTPAIFYGIENVQATDGGAVTAEKFSIFVEILLCDSGQYNDSSRRISRYSRAIKEVFEENFDKFPFAGKTKIETVGPASYRLESDNSEEIKIGGVAITATVV